MYYLIHINIPLSVMASTSPSKNTLFVLDYKAKKTSHHLKK